MREIIVGSRRSELALVQSHWVIEQLKQSQPNVKVKLEKVVTRGDRILNVTLSKVGGKGLFVKEIEQALFERRIDLAVHSMKDLPGEVPSGLVIAAIPERVSPFDCLISSTGKTLENLPKGAVVGTSSLRRQAQLLAIRPDLVVKPLRGNIDTRLRRLQEGEFDAIVLATAGLQRMGWEGQITEILGPSTLLPAVGQGALAIQCRKEDSLLIEWLQSLHHEQTAKAVMAERSFLQRLNGGCHFPIAGYATVKNDQIELTGLVGRPDGKEMLRCSLKGTDAWQLGQKVAENLLDQGARELLSTLEEESVI